MRTNTLVTLGASVAFGVLAVLLARGWISNAVETEFRAAPITRPIAERPAPVETQPVMVAAIDLSYGDALTHDSLRRVDYPIGAVPAGAFSDFESVFGAYDDNADWNEDGEAAMDRPVVALSNIAAMEPILPGKISGPGGRGSLSTQIAPGFVATAVQVSAVSGVAGFALPGDHVDVIYIHQPDPDKQPDLYQSDVIAQSVRVLGVDQDGRPDASDVAVRRTVTLEVDRRDLQRLALAERAGQIHLALRGAGEVDFAAAETIRSTQISKAQAASKPAPRRPRVSPPQRDDRTQVKIVRKQGVEQVTVRRDTPTQSASLAGANTSAPSPESSPTSSAPLGLAGGQ